MKMKITNTSKANQGVWASDGTLVTIEPGQTREVAVAEDYVERVKRLPFLKVDGGPLDHDANGGAGGSVDELDQMKAPDLRALAVTEGVDLKGITKKADVIAAIRAKRAAPTATEASSDEDPRTDDELRAAVVEQLGEEGSADLDRPAMLALLAPQA